MSISTEKTLFMIIKLLKWRCSRLVDETVTDTPRMVSETAETRCTGFPVTR